MKKIALITGAARNIGKGISRKLLSEGYECILLDKDADELAKTGHELKKGGELHQYVADITNTAQIDSFVKWLKEKDIRVNVLINNVAHESTDTLLNVTPQEMIKSYHTNLIGPFYLTSLISKEWVESGVKGNIIFLSSTHGHIIRTHPLYSSSKAAIEMFMKESTLELAPYGIRVNAIAPGAVRDTKELVEDYRAPLGFCIQPQDVAEGVSFLLSDGARFITGQSLTIDGGYSITHTHYWLNQGKLPPMPKV